MKKYWIEGLVGIVGGLFLWWQLATHHVGGAYSLQQQMILIAALVATCFLLVRMYRHFGLQIIGVASGGQMTEERAWAPCSYVAGALLLLQLLAIALLPGRLAAAAAVEVIGIGLAGLAAWSGRGGRGRWLVPLIVVAASVVAALVSAELSSHSR